MLSRDYPLTPGAPRFNLASLRYMSDLTLSLIALGCFVGGVVLGMWFQYLLPEHHLSKESQDTVKLGAGMVATMSALILSLLVSSAKNSFDAVNASIAQTGAKVIQLDHLLAGYGPETQELRTQLKSRLAGRIEKIWATRTSESTGLNAIEKSTSTLDFQALLGGLKPQNEPQRLALMQAQQIGTEIWQSRLMLIEQQQTALPPVFLVLLVFWLTLLFVSFGLFAPRNGTVFAMLFVCALSVSSAVFLILEMNHPLDGFIKVSSAPLVKALELIGQ
jgi:hypothetical protein